MSEPLLRLIPHPTTVDARVDRIEASVRRAEDGRLRFFFRLAGDLARLRVPLPRRPAPTHELWRHTCFEAFIGREGDPSYRELNVSPSREWASYGFARYRERATELRAPATPDIDVRRSPTALEVDVAIAAGELPRGALAVGLSAVIEGDDGALSYWALHHPRPRPDFHDEAARVLRLEPIASEC